LNKKNYVKTAKTVDELCFRGNLSSCSLLSRSSGFSGKASSWAKSREEQQESKNFAALGLDLLFGITHKKTLLIDSFALGSWVSGVDLLMIADSKCSVVAPGADINETLDLLIDMKNEYEQFLIAGTPHFLKFLIEEAIKRKIPLNKFKINILAGGESFTEDWRQYMNSLLGNTMYDDNTGFVFSAYGASDLGVTGVNETHESAQIRYSCMKNKKLREDIFGRFSSTLPMLFQYDPTKYFIEVNQKAELVFSNCDLKALMPLIRYNIHDVGGVVSYREMQDILKKNGVDLKLKAPLPFVFVVGRSDGTVNFVGSIVYPEYVHDALIKHSSIYELITGAFRISTKCDQNNNPYLQINIQLKESVNKTTTLQTKIKSILVDFFSELDNDFAQNISLIKSKTKKNPIRVSVYNNKSYPYIDGIKIKYVE